MVFSRILIMAGCVLSLNVPALAKDKFEDFELSGPDLFVQNENTSTKIQKASRNDTVAKISILPSKIATIESAVKVDTSMAPLKLDAQENLFAVNTDSYGTIYCGYKNILRNRIGTVLEQGCLGDKDQNGVFDQLFHRVGSNFKDIGGFLYHDAEIELLNVDISDDNIAYTVGPAQQKHGHTLSLRYNRITKENDKYYAVFDVLIKFRKQKKWYRFAPREEIKVAVESDTETMWDTSLFTAKIEKVSRSRIKFTFIDVKSHSTNFGYKRGLGSKMPGSVGFNELYGRLPGRN